MTAKERRDRRKQKRKAKNGVVANDDDDDNDDGSTERQPIAASNRPNKQQHKEPQPVQAPQPTRGQRRKNKKIKQKYKDQDEEDRQMVMEFYQAGKAPKVSKKNKGKQMYGPSFKKFSGPKMNPQVGNKQAAAATAEKPQEENKVNEQQHQLAATQPESHNNDSSNNDQGKEAAAAVADSDDDEKRPETFEPVTNLLESLTGQPHVDDHLLFAIPVCAPYNAMKNYKFKVKMTPGANKKGKATKTALGMFQASRDTNPQEMDHLRSVKDYDLSRNLPGRVKLSAPNLQGLRQKHKHKRR